MSKRKVNTPETWKDRVGVVYSTDPNFEYETHDREEETETLPPQEQKLKIFLDKKNRKGKVVSVVGGFVGSEKDLKELGKLLKSKCGVGGTVKYGAVFLQGDHRDFLMELLAEAGYKVRRSG